MTPISAVQVGRMALGHIGVRSNIESLSENTPEAKAVNLWLEFSRKQTLEGFNWSFARKRLTLATHNDPPPEGQWGFRYQYPSDALVIRSIQSPFSVSGSGGLINPTVSISTAEADAVPYNVEISTDGTNSILTNVQDAIAIYTFDQTQLTMFSSLAIMALSFALASNIAFSLTARRDVEDRQLQQFFITLQQAAVSDANQSIAAPVRDAEWIRGR